MCERSEAFRCSFLTKPFPTCRGGMLELCTASNVVPWTLISLFRKKLDTVTKFVHMFVFPVILSYIFASLLSSTCMTSLYVTVGLSPLARIPPSSASCYKHQRSLITKQAQPQRHTCPCKHRALPVRACFTSSVSHFHLWTIRLSTVLLSLSSCQIRMDDQFGD